MEDGLRVVVARGRLFDRLGVGAMLSVGAGEEEVRGMLGGELSVAAVNGPRQVVVSGSAEAITEMEKELEGAGIEYGRLHIDVAAHSRMVEGILDEYGEVMKEVEKEGPRIPIISNVTGGWMSEEEARSWEYWVKQLRGTVRFSEGVEEVRREKGRVMIEVGPGQTLSTLVRMGWG